jgi:hypothetical protein
MPTYIQEQLKEEEERKGSVSELDSVRAEISLPQELEPER